MIKRITILMLLLFPFSAIFAQVDDKQKEENEKKAQKANELYSKYAYVDAIKIYERIAEQGYVDQTILQNLGNSYYFNADYTNALKWYDQLFKNAEKDNYTLTPEYYYRYAQTLKSAERYQEATAILQQFMKLTGREDIRARKLEEHTDYLKVIKDNSGRLTIKPVDINTEYSEYGTAFYGPDAVVFTASRKPSLFREASKWTGEGYYDLFKTSLKDGNLHGEERFSSVLNTSLNESSPIFTKNLDTIYFTRNYLVPLTKEEKKKKNRDEKILLELYRSVKKGDNTWAEPVRLPFNVTGYSVAHPALTPDGKYLYFAADIVGTHGKSDIFRVKINHDKGTYGKPENLGEIINTEGRETFPFISQNNVLFFASDGLPGLGGLDIFAVKINQDGSLKGLQNIGRPGNTPDDDFAFILDEQKSMGFLSSNRPGGKGKDDIYYFIQNRPLEFDCYKVIKGIVKDADTQETLSNVLLTLSDSQQKEITRKTNEANGTFDFGKNPVDCDDTFVFVRAQKEDYAVAEEQINIRQNGEIHQEIFLKSIKKKVTVGDDLAKFFNIEIIYFDFDKSNIRPDAAVDLAKIVEVMKEHPTIKIAIKSHTDSRGSDAYNLALSDRRAKSTLEWMVQQGIDRSRLTAKGYGETQLVNGCSNGVPCSEEEHQKNRRSEFIITEM